MEIYESEFDSLGHAKIEFVQNDTLILYLKIGNMDQDETKFHTNIYFEPRAEINLTIENGNPKFDNDLKIINSYYSKIFAIEVEGYKYVNENIIRCLRASNLEKQVYLDSLMQFNSEIKKQIKTDDLGSDYYQQLLINYASRFEIVQRMHFNTQLARIETNNNGSSVFLDSTLSTAFNDLMLHQTHINDPLYISHLSDRLMLIFDDISNYRYENKIEIEEYDYVKGAIVKDKRLNNYQELLIALLINYMGRAREFIYDSQVKMIDLFRRDYQHSQYLEGLTYILTDYEEFREGKPMKDLEMEDINGKTFKLSDLSGNLIYLDIWATWCGPCIDELEHSVKLSEKYSNYPDLKFLYLSIDQDTQLWKKFLQKNSKIKGLHGIQNAEFVADSNMVTTLYKFHAIPRYIVIDKNGNIVTTNAKFPSQLLSVNYLDSLLSIN